MEQGRPVAEVSRDGADVRPPTRARTGELRLHADAAPRVTLSWLIGLRWAALVAQAVLLAIATHYQVLATSRWPALLVALGALSNVGLVVLDRVPGLVDSRALLGAALLTDVLLLSGLLMVTGGPANPFSIVFLVYVTLAAVALGAGWTWLIVTTSVSGYAALFIWHIPLSEHAAHAAGLPSHLAGMWLAFAAGAALIAFFVTGVTGTLARRERELEEMRVRAAQHERLASLTTLAAGAAHELATPLASISVAAGELERAVLASGADDFLEDIRLIRSQVQRCRVILDQMSGRANPEWVGGDAPVPVAEAIRRVGDELGPAVFPRLRIEGDSTLLVAAPPSGLVQVLFNLVKNAFDASPPDGVVSLRIETRHRDAAFVVTDHGMGMSPEVLARAGEPFFTTKAAGTGFGLGLFLVRLFAERHGGHLEIDSRPNAGTRAVLSLPRASS